MGSMGVHFPITEGLDGVWGYDGTLAGMRTVLDYFAYSRELVNEELAQVRYQGANEPGFQEAFSSMFPAPGSAGWRPWRCPKQRSVPCHTTR